MKYPEDGEADDFHDQESCPRASGGVLAGPEEGLVYGIGLKFLVEAFEPPHLLSILVEVVPPTQSHQQPPSHILDCPEVQRTEEHDYDEGIDIAEEIAQYEVAEWRQGYTRKAAALKRKVKMQATGWAACESPPSICGGGFRLSCKLGFAVAAIGIYKSSLCWANHFDLLHLICFIPKFLLSDPNVFKAESAHQIQSFYYSIHYMREENRINQQFQDNNQDSTCYESVLQCCGDKTGCLRAWLPCCCCCCPYPYQEVRQGTKGLMERFGKWTRTLEPGLHYINPCTESLTSVSLLTSVLDLERQLILTKDNITVNIDTCVYYRIIDPKIAYYTIANIQLSVAEVTYATLRTICGENTLQDLLEKRQEIADVIENYVYEKVNKWGIYVEQIFIKDMMLAKELQRDLSMTSKTERLSKAKIISAEADVKSAKLMHQASDILNSKAAMQIRYLEILQAIAKGGGQKIMFLPLSSEEFDQ